jgi:1-acyl-sn-glycerol-3-phosphate acyltransferase
VSRATPKPRSLQPHAWAITRFLRHFVVRPITRLKLFTTHHVTGASNVPEQGGAIVAANHPSNLEPPALFTALSRNVTFLAKAELWRVPVLKYFMRLLGQIPVDRGNRQSGEKAQASALRVLQYQNRRGKAKGGVVLIFPEGGCTPKGGEMRPFKSGVWYLALQSGAPVVPCGIRGTEDIRLRPSTIWRRRQVPQVHVHFGEPLYARDFATKEDFLTELRVRIEALRTAA